MRALAATQVFTGEEMLGPATVYLADGGISHVEPGVLAATEVFDGCLAPGLIDVQVNGGGGALFNDEPSVDTLRTIAQAHTSFGVTGIMATLISDARHKIGVALDAVDQGLHEGVPGLLGLHLEGPWLAPPRRGVHPGRFLRALDADDMERLARRRRFPVLATVAPESAAPADVRALADAGVIVSIGHTAAEPADIEALLAAGATGFTHLFNAMPPLEGRRPGPVGAALANRDAWCGIILDGIHVHPVSARVAFAAKSSRKLMLVSDAMATVGSEDPRMSLFGEPIESRAGALRTADGTLAGAHLDLSAAVRNAVSMLGATPEDALRMASRTPAEFLGVASERGRIIPGARADLVLFEAGLTVRHVWIAGEQIR